MKEEVASNRVPSGSQMAYLEPPRKQLKVQKEREDEDPYYLNDSEVQKDMQFVQALLLKEEPGKVNEYEEAYENETYTEYKKEKYEEEYEEEGCEDDYLEEDFEEQKEIIVQDPGFSDTTGTSYASSSSLSTDENSAPVPTTSLLSTPTTSFIWSSNTPPFRPKFSFCGQSGSIKTPSGTDPHNFFNLLFTNEFFQLLVQETNAFAEELFLRQGWNPHSRISHWKDTTEDEMKIFIGLLFHMGVIKVNRLADYWNRNEKFDMKYFQTRMSKNRWLIMQQAFHLARNPVVGDSVAADPLFKIRPLLELFHKNMKAIQVPAKKVCIAEPMVPWRGRISACQDTFNKSIKLYMLTEPDGLIHRLLLYAGSADKEICGLEHIRKVVFKLMFGLLGEGRSIYMDNYYTSIDLASNLLNQQTYITGTLRASRKNNPSDIMTVELKKGKLVQWWSQNGINVTKWKDKGHFLTVSTEFSGDLVNISGRQVGAKKPQVVVEYNKNMRGIDRINQSLSYYISPRRTLQWYKKFSFHIFELMLFNCYILYCRSSGMCRLDLHDFRLAIVDYLCGPNPSPSPSVIITPAIINRTHFPRIAEIPEGRARRRQRRCRYCSKLNIKTLTTTYCAGCPENPGLCMSDCFLSYHQNKGFHLM